GENVVKVYFNGDSYAEITVYAYAVVFDSRGASAVDAIYVAKGDEVILPELSAEDYAGAERAVFEGWYTLPDLTGIYDASSYAGDGMRYVSGTVFDRNTTLVLYAFWTIEPVSVSLDAGSYGTLDGGATADAEIAYGSDTYTLPVPEASDPGKIFYGWYSAENGRGTRYSDGYGNAVSGTKYTRADGETLYAYWIVVLEFSVTTYQRETLASVSAGADADKVSELSVPDTVKIDGTEYTVGVVGNDAFGNCQSLVTVNLPDTVRYVSTTGNGYTTGSGAFANSKNIQSVNIVPYEGTYERYYYSADGVLFKKDSSSDTVSVVYYPFGRTETDYTLPSEVCNVCEYADAFGTDILYLSVTTIESRVFYNHSELVTVTVPSSVTAVYSEAFYSCTGLVSVKFESDGGAGTLTIGEKAFRNCVKLGEVTLPSRLTDFDPAIFTSCGVLENIYVSGTGDNYSSANGLLCDASGTEILYCPAGRSGTIEIGVFGTALENVSAVADGAFSSCVYITGVVIGERVAYIGESAFSSCTRLASIEFEQGDANSVKLSIAYKAFYGCTSSSLTEVTLPARLSSLSECAFGNCSKLTTVYYDSWAGATADDLSGLESYAFCTTESSSGTRTSYVTKIVLGPNVPAINFAAVFGGSELKSVEIDEDNQNMSVDGALIFDKDRTRVLYCMVTAEGTATLPDTVTSIADNAFYNCAGITGVVLDDGIQYIGAQAFYMCTSLAVINFPEGLKEIGDEAFYGCSSLVSVSLPASLERMGEYNYRGTLVSMDVFEGCTSLKSIEVAEGNENFVTIDGVLYLANFSSSAQQTVATELLLCPLNNAVAEIEIPSTVTSIVANAFKGNTGITKVSFADGMITGSLVIGDNAFSGAVNLETIELPTGLTAIGAQMFRQCESLVTVTVPYTVTYIGAQAFFSCTSLEYVIFDKTPEGVSEVPLEFDGGYEFADTPSLVSVALPDRTTGMTAYMFYYSGIKEVVIGANVESVPNYCFSYASDLQSVTFGEKDDSASKLKSIGNNSFSHTGGSFELVLPEGFTSFSTQSFYQSAGLKKIYIPNTCSSFSQQTFSGCSSLEEVIFEEGAASVNFSANQLFTNCTSLKRITVPASVTNIAASTFSGCESLEEVTFETDDGYSSLASMGNYVFSGTGLKSFTFPDTDPSRSDGGAISFSADCEIFRWCDSLTEITLSNAVQSGLGDALGQAYHVTAINKGTCTAYDIQGCVVYSTTTGETAYVFGDVGEELTLPWQVTSVGDYAFQYVNTLKSVSLPVSTATIGAYAFDGCTALESVTFYEPTDAELGDDRNAYAPAESVSLGKYCFRNCTSLKEIVLPENLTEIGTSISANGYQFTGCTKLEKVTLSSRTTSLSTYMFEGCSALKIITYTDDTEYDEANRPEYLETGYMSLPSSVAMLGNSCFRRSGLVTALVPHIPSGTSGVGTYLFAECPNLVTVVFADGADALNTYMFYGCASLTEISVPSTVSSLPNYCFQGCTALRSVTIPEGITSVGTYLFDGCTSLESVEFPASLTTITVSSSRSSLFQGCESLKSVTFRGDAVTTTTLGNYAFYGCSSLESVEIPSSITALGTYAFYGCSSLKYVDTSNVRTYGTYCFYGCSSLVCAELSGSTTSIGTYMFCGCASLETVTLGGTYTALTDYMFAGCTSLESVEIPVRITYLGTHTFQGCTSLKEITLPSSLGALGASSSSWSADGAAYTFDGCTSLTKVVLGSVVEGISGYVFRNCSALKIVTYDGDIDYSPDNDDYYMTYGYFALPSSLTTIGDYAFAGTGLTYVTLPAFTALSGSTGAVGAYAFADCKDLVSVTFDNSTTKMSDGMFSGCTSLVSVTVPSQVSALGSYQFDGCASLEEVSFLGNATEISVGAFKGCTSLTEADVPGAVETISDYAFCDCTSLEHVRLPDTVTLIGKHAFENCSALGSIAIPELTETIDDFAFAGSGLTEIALSEFVTYIGEAAFGGCDALASMTIDSSNPRYDAEDDAMITDKDGKLITVTASVTGEVAISGGRVTEIGEYAFYGADGITKIVLDGVSVIDANAFLGLGSLTEASLGGVTHIGAHAFEGTALTSVAIPSTVAEIGGYAFRGLEGLTETTFDAGSTLTTIGEYAFAGTGLTSVSLPESLTTVCGHAFEGTSLSSVTLGSGMTYVGEYAFADVGTLTSVEIDCAAKFGDGVFAKDANLASVTFGGNARTDVSDYMFYGCVSLTDVSLPESVTRIGSHAFEGTSVASVSMPGIVSVGDYAFNAVESLTDVTMSNSLVSVGDHAFAETGVTSLSILSSLETIGDYAFFGCASLATVDLSAAATLSLGAYAFADCACLTAVTINPDTYLTIGDYAFANDMGIASVSISYENTASIGEGAFSGWSSTQTVIIDSSRYLASHKWMWTAKTAVGEAAKETWIYGCDATFVYTG
ncbi:MAG: leucine-rich repeat domain-containing protein, partial [Bacteroidales bacterium]|nr:leucine-rich repeat domain-containing protein [Bacteroidales bacterium]